MVKLAVIFASGSAVVAALVVGVVSFLPSGGGSGAELLETTPEQGSGVTTPLPHETVSPAEPTAVAPRSRRSERSYSGFDCEATSELVERLLFHGGVIFPQIEGGYSTGSIGSGEWVCTWGVWPDGEAGSNVWVSASFQTTDQLCTGPTLDDGSSDQYVRQDVSHLLNINRLDLYTTFPEALPDTGILAIADTDGGCISVGYWGETLREDNIPEFVAALAEVAADALES